MDGLAGRWLPIVKAAHELRLSERTLRQRIHQGEHRAREGERGAEVWVAAPGMPGASAGLAGRVPGALGDPALTGAGGGWVPVMPGILLDTAPGEPDVDARQAPEVAREAIAAMRELVKQERERSGSLERRASQAEQAAAMRQERARNLEGEVGRLQELLALPAHGGAAPRRRWWQWWRPGAGQG